MNNQSQDSLSKAFGMQGNVRVRFAPSPTGPLHIGGVRTALFNYLFAKKHGGTFVLRIEDTDQTRYVEGAENYIIEALNWCHIPFDEGPGKDEGFGPYRQSERKELYKQYANQLLASGNAYYAFDSNESLDAHRKDHEAKGKTFIYNHHNREKLDNSLSLDKQTLEKRLESGEPYVIRFKTPTNQTIMLHDLIRGSIQIDSNVLDDKVLFKSDGMPTYHLANIVDDHLMQITHVIRGEEWLPSLALHKLLYDAFEWQAPKFAHLPLIMKPVGKGKLSKRDGDKMGFPVFPLQWQPKDGEPFSGYREEGYLPEAVINMLAMLGWNPGTEQELFSLDQLIQTFDLARVTKGGSKFDPEKTKWFQNHYFQNLTTADLAASFAALLQQKNINHTLDLEKIISLVKERASFVSELWEQSHYFFEAPKTLDAKAMSKVWIQDTPEILKAVTELIKTSPSVEESSLSATIKSWISANELGFGKVMQPLRLALVGEMKGVDVFAIIELIGKEETISRIEKAIAAG